MRFDLHIHSRYSEDSKSTLEDIIEKARRENLDGLALMDHNTLEGFFEAQKIDTELIIIPGMEVSTDDGHVMALGVQEDIETRLSIPETIDRIREKGGLAVAAHPSRFWSGMGKENALGNSWDAVEGMNGRSWEIKNNRAQKIAEDLDLPVTGGSDSHRVKTVGKAYTIIEDVERWEDLIPKVEKGDTDVGGNSRDFAQTFFYVRRALGGWMKRGFKRI